ncbi:SusD/RagB family nutrient-binding outer membrane lipoprotein [Euzebyella marina]|uniref:SusD/RagB family nutrient-binding outer membrane lipoprotein n=1 Tax=Euzebyella marina TaxID=1761453 RepID=A0A3G2L9R4_9FLAO|nr:SusD/RagB family nutrient-binding outer membrane lipoprotein [Euzebyella marina]AYN69008.1 SusD/RagB family nutrient-binding outer membrane lipoprotein [Euzebyella marina]MAU71908.1 SusD/RagB family nutrient-binding outer membrane lipoprotein [Pseudozobellia sp.]MBG48577.1 SusD/RagB family nutrient-binding outer membrane lipoprotein [Pseudozobellia sp.]|tara:strand:+ start:505763 stop:507181 length:1419 start_codon:yes stop_codon:yes gene_type:complete
MKKYFITFISIALIAVSCEVNEEYNRDSKYPTIVPGSGLFTNAARNLFDLMNSASVNDNVFRLYAQYWAQTTYPDESQYNQITRNIGGSIWNTLYRDVLQDLKGARANLIEEEADNLNNKLAIIEFMEVYAYSVLVDTFGDVPYSEALDFENSTPAYDDAGTIYASLIEKLNGAITSMGSGSGFEATQDPIYGGDMTKWRKAANSLRLRMALRLADVNASLAQSTAEAAAAATLITENADNFGIQYLGAAPNTNPVWVSLVQSGRNDFVAADTFIDVLNGLEDPRRQFYFETLDGEYVGGIYGSANSPASASAISDLLKAPDLIGNILTASEVHFLLSEAAARGYAVGGTQEEFYAGGIETSILEWGGTQEEIDAYLAQPSVAYATAEGDWKQKIATQKWIAMFNNGMEGWTTWRLFDQPTLNVPDGFTAEDIPTRFLYPISEATLNGEELDAAISAIGGDSQTTKLFWDVN